MNSKRLILAALFSAIVLVGWGLLFPPADRPAEAPVDDAFVFHEPTAPSPSLAGAERPRSNLAPIGETAEREVEIESDGVIARFSNKGAQLVSLRLKDTRGGDGQALEMVRDQEQGPFPFALIEPDRTESALNRVLFEVEELGPGLRFSYRGPEGAAEKKFAFTKGGLLEVGITVEGRTDWSLMMGPGLRNPSEQEFVGRNAGRRYASYNLAGEVETVNASKARESSFVDGGGVRWVALEDTYFLTMLAPSRPIQQLTIEPMLPRTSAVGAGYLPYPLELTESQEDLRADFRVLVTPGAESFSGMSFWGAKRYKELAALPGDLGLEELIRWSRIGFLARPMLWALLWIHDNMVQNFGWSIILLTMLIKILVAPLTHKSYVSSRKMQALQPKMNEIKQKYRSKLKDKKGRPNMEAQRKQSEELQALMRKVGVSPLGGCLPMLMQTPFFFAFYTLLEHSVELWNAPWAFWIQDLSAMDPLYILPIVLAASQFLQQLLVGATSAEPSQRIMMNLMPIMFLFFFIQAASGLVLYWTTSNLLTIFQQGVYRWLRSKGFFGGGEATSDAL